MDYKQTVSTFLYITCTSNKHMKYQKNYTTLHVPNKMCSIHKQFFSISLPHIQITV